MSAGLPMGPVVTVEPYQLPVAWLARCGRCGVVFRDNDQGAVIRFAAEHVAEHAANGGGSA